MDKPHPSSLRFKSRTLSEDGKVYHIAFEEEFKYNISNNSSGQIQMKKWLHASRRRKAKAVFQNKPCKVVQKSEHNLCDNVKHPSKLNTAMTEMT